ncbi:HPP family protein, partial [Vibrio parahaemolyticus VPTS-2010]
QRIHLRVQILS